MLVISRKTGESLVIGDNITVKIVSVSSDKVTIGIDAPRDISIVRSELLATIEENKASADAPTVSISHDDAHSIAEMMKKQRTSRLIKR